MGSSTWTISAKGEARESGLGSATPTPAPAPIATTRAFEIGVDRPGSDYRNFALPAADPALCSAQCSREGQCRAWTYVKPGVQGPEPRCWLKDRVPDPVPGADSAISGVRAGAAAPQPVPGLAPAPAPALAPGRCRGFAGVWNIYEFGRTVLTQEGDRISGTYDRGTLAGTLKGTVLEAEWVNSSGNGLRGTTRLELLPDGSLKGKAETTGWIGTIVGVCDTRSAAP